MTNVHNYLAKWTSREFDDRITELRKRPDKLYGNIEIPTVRDIDEAEFLCHEFGAVLTAGPDAKEVQWGHPNHRVWTFDDTTDMLRGPGYRTVAEMVEWGAQQEDLLVHCHAGMSRSTATAWGISIARGADPLDSLVALIEAHPREPFRDERRAFGPNALIVTYLERILGDNNLLEIRERVLMDDPTNRLWV
jgi:hypothetical protein